MRTTFAFGLAALLLTTGLLALPGASADAYTCVSKEFGHPYPTVTVCTGGPGLCAVFLSPGVWVQCDNPIGDLLDRILP